MEARAFSYATFCYLSRSIQDAVDLCTIRPCMSISVLIFFCENSGRFKQRTPKFPVYTKLKGCLPVFIMFALAIDASKAQCFDKLHFF